MHRGLGEIRVTKEILVHKGHLEVVVLGLRVLKPSTTTATQGPKGDTGPISPKLTVVLEVEMVKKGTLEHRGPSRDKGDRGPQGPSGGGDSADLPTVS